VRGFFAHLVPYVAVNAFLVAIWTFTSGSPTELRQVWDDPATAKDLGFWPMWPMMAWGTALAIHLGGAVLALTRPRRPRRLEAPRSPELVHDAAPRRRWLVVMFTDVCDSTALNEQLGDERWHCVLSDYRDVVRSATAHRGGTEVATTGDGFLVRFDSPSDAVLCAVDVQRALAGLRESGALVLHTRIGLHAGEVVDLGDDVLGQVVNLASRVSSAAEPDEILVTEPVADQLVGALHLEDRGLQPLKGLTQQRHLLAVRWAEAAAT
jgi:class 3 adenylate cyclase